MHLSALNLALFSFCPLVFFPQAAADPTAQASNGLFARQGTSADSSCNAFTSIFASCTSATPGITDLPFSVAASCFCYSSSIWKPSAYDGAVATCLAYFSTADPAYYSSLSESGGIQTTQCQEVGNVITSASAFKTTSAPTLSPSAGAILTSCASWENIYASCGAASPSFSVQPPDVQASCLCYVNSTYAPSIYDGAFDTCWQYIKTASPALYSSGMGAASTFCEYFGDVRATGSTTVTATAAAGSTATAISATSTVSALTTTEPTTAARGAASTISVHLVLGMLVGFSVLVLVC
jgi:hypothetical protein